MKEFEKQIPAFCYCGKDLWLDYNRTVQDHYPYNGKRFTLYIYVGTCPKCKKDHIEWHTNLSARRKRQ